MNLITITTDLGLRDGYVASLKGAIYSTQPTSQVVDLIHDIAPYDIVVGSLFLRQALRHFPIKTVHIAVVDVLYDEYGSLLIGRQNDHIIIAPNNGMLSLLGLDDTDEVYLSEYVYEDFEGFLNGMKLVLKHLFSESPIATLGSLYPGHKRRFDLQATIRQDQIQASVVHVDRFENAILNVDQQLFEDNRKGRSFGIYYKRSEPINAISSSYGSVPIGEVVAVFNSYGLLEIGINKGKAHSLLGLVKEDAIIIEFEEN